MKKIYLLFIGLFVSGMILSQTIIFEDDFESYTAGTSVGSQTTDWTTWSGGTGGAEDAMVSIAQANGGVNSMNVIANNDMIYNFGNKTSGIYQVEFYYYVPTGAEAYFNIEHIFGSEWAFSCEFAAGTMGLNSDGGAPTLTVAYPQDTWMYFVIDVDLGSDEIVLTLDGTEVSTWVFSTIEGGGSGLNQLGCINFYGPANNNYFIDDFVYTEIVSGLIPPTIDITVVPIVTDGSASETISFGNTGEEVMGFRSYGIYNEPVLTIKGEKDGILNIDGTYASAIGWASQLTVKAAVRFMPDLTSPFVGQEIVSVDIYIGDQPLNDTITVYVWEKDGFIVPGASTILAQKGFICDTAWNNIVLDVPVLLTGEEVWVGFEFTDPGSLSYCLAEDGGPVIPDANYVSTGPVWTEYSSIGGTGNLNIRANVVGIGWPEWMSVTPASGTVVASGTQDLTLDFITTGLLTGQYTGDVVIGCNDALQEWTEIPVTLDYIVGIDNVTNIGIMTYPNPVRDEFNIIAHENITSVEVYNASGQIVISDIMNSMNASIDMNELKGFYIVKINTENSQIIKKIIVE